MSHFLQLENLALFADILTFEHNVLLLNNVDGEISQNVSTKLKLEFWRISSEKQEKLQEYLQKKMALTPK